MDAKQKQKSQKQAIIGIDVGGSTTKICGFRYSQNGRELIAPLFVRATDPVTSIYGAFGRFTAENGLALTDLDRIMVTGGGSSYLSAPIYALDCRNVPEFDSIGLGGLYLSGLSEAIVVSMGTGTALVHAKRGADGKTAVRYLGGTGMGGGTLLGLTRRLIGVDTVEHIEALCESGNLENVDLRIRDISRNRLYSEMDDNITVANFGKVSDMASQNDLALGVANMIAETVAMLAVFAARGADVQNIVLTGNLSVLHPIRQVFLGLGEKFGKTFILPENGRFGTVIGAALYEEEQMIH